MSALKRKERSELPQAARLESTEAGVMRPEWMRELERRSMDGEITPEELLAEGRTRKMG